MQQVPSQFTYTLYGVYCENIGSRFPYAYLLTLRKRCTFNTSGNLELRMLWTPYGDRDDRYSVLPERYRKILQSNLNAFHFFNFEFYVFISSNDFVLELNPETFIFNPYRTNVENRVSS